MLQGGDLMAVAGNMGSWSQGSGGGWAWGSGHLGAKESHSGDRACQPGGWNSLTVRRGHTPNSTSCSVRQSSIQASIERSGEINYTSTRGRWALAGKEESPFSPKLNLLNPDIMWERGGERGFFERTGRSLTGNLNFEWTEYLPKSLS